MKREELERINTLENAIALINSKTGGMAKPFDKEHNSNFILMLGDNLFTFEHRFKPKSNYPDIWYCKDLTKFEDCNYFTSASQIVDIINVRDVINILTIEQLNATFKLITGKTNKLHWD